MSTKKEVVLTINENGSFSINANISSIDILGLIEYAKEVIKRDLFSTDKVKKEPTPVPNEIENE